MSKFGVRYILAIIPIFLIVFVTRPAAFGNPAHPDPGWHVEKANYSFNPVQTLSGIGTFQEIFSDMNLEQTANTSPAPFFLSPQPACAPPISAICTIPELQRDTGQPPDQNPGINNLRSALDNTRYFTAKTNRQYDFEPGGI